MLLARSLVVFMAVGVVSGLLFGVYLAGIKDANHIVYVEGHSLSVVTDKPVYKSGETVMIRIINSGTVPLDFHDTAYGFYVTDLLNIRILTPGIDCQTTQCPNDVMSVAGVSLTNFESAGMDMVLESREEIVLLWSQTQNDNTAVVSGVYKIHSESSSVAASTTITIL